MEKKTKQCKESIKQSHFFEKMNKVDKVTRKKEENNSSK